MINHARNTNHGESPCSEHALAPVRLPDTSECIRELESAAIVCGG